MTLELEQSQKRSPDSPAIPNPKTPLVTAQEAARLLNSEQTERVLARWQTDPANGSLKSDPTQQPRVLDAVKTLIGGTARESEVQLFESSHSGAFKRDNDRNYISGAILKGDSRIPFLIPYPISGSNSAQAPTGSQAALPDSNIPYVLQGEKLWRNRGGDERRDEILQGSNREAPTNLSDPKNLGTLRSWDAKWENSELKFISNPTRQQALQQEIQHHLALPSGYLVSLQQNTSGGAVQTVNFDTHIVRGRIYSGGKDPVGEFTLQFGEGKPTLVSISSSERSDLVRFQDPLKAEGGRVAQTERVKSVLTGGSER